MGVHGVADVAGGVRDIHETLHRVAAELVAGEDVVVVVVDENRHRGVVPVVVPEACGLEGRLDY